MASTILAAASGVQIPDHVLDTFKALPYPICPVPDAGLNMDRDGQSLVYSQNTDLLFKYSRVKSYVPLLPSL